MIEVKEDAGCVSKVLREHKDSISDICAGVIADRSIVVSFRVGFQKEANMSIPPRQPKVPTIPDQSALLNLWGELCQINSEWFWWFFDIETN